jgi:hypothetical protein
VTAKHNDSEGSSFRPSTVDCQPLLRFDVNALPERDVILDLRSRRLRRRIKPRGVVVPHPVHLKRVVMRRTLPRALRSMRARLQEFFLYRVGREILISFYNFRRAAFRYDFSTPSRFRHSVSPLLAKLPHVRPVFLSRPGVAGPPNLVTSILRRFRFVGCFSGDFDTFSLQFGLFEKKRSRLALRIPVNRPFSCRSSSARAAEFVEPRAVLPAISLFRGADSVGEFHLVYLPRET